MRLHRSASPEVAEYLILERSGRGLGYDFIQEKYSNVKPPPPELAPGQNDSLPIHHVVLGNDRCHVEYLTNIESDRDRFKLVVAPLKWAGLEASPVRVLPILD